MKRRYGISRFYRTRNQYHHHDDSPYEDQWQLEVYLHALGLMKKHQLASIADIGCGSGYKLITYLGEFETIGFELPVNVDILKKRYPHRKWFVSDFSVNATISSDVILCSDVIEHLVDPDELLTFIKTIAFKYLVLSTPDRSLVYRPWHMGFFGPPRNKAHVREWTFKEFNRYISGHFNIVDHRVVNLKESTQLVIATPM